MAKKQSTEYRQHVGIDPKTNKTKTYVLGGGGKDETIGAGFMSWANLIPAYIDRNWNTTTGTQNPVILVAPGSMLCRGTVIKIIRTEVWGMEPEERNRLLLEMFPDKPQHKLVEICNGLKGGIKDKISRFVIGPPKQITKATHNPTWDAIWSWIDGYNKGALPNGWSSVLENVGFDPNNDPWDRFGPVNRTTLPNWNVENNMGPASAIIQQLSLTAIWNELVNQDLPNEETVAGIKTRGNVITGSTQAETLKAFRGQLTDEQKMQLANREGAINKAFLEGSGSSEKTEEELEQERLQQIRFQTQCLLANHVEYLAKQNKKRGEAKGTGYPRTMLLDGPPYQLMNKLTYKKGSEKFAKITVPEASSLVPMIKLSKIYYDDEGKPSGEKKIVFDTYTRTEDLLSADSGGRSGVGIKSFEWDLNGTNIATVESDITAKMVLYFNNFNDLLAQNHEGFKYVDLLVRKSPPTGESKSVSDKSAEAKMTKDNKNDQKFYEIKAEVGWAYNNDYILDYEKKYALEKALKSQRLTLFLTLVEHEFDISQDGAFTLTINYRARMDGIFMDKRADVIMGPEEKNEMCAANEELREAKELGDDKKQAAAKKRIADAKINFTFESSQYIFDKLLNRGAIYYGSINQQTLLKYPEGVFDIPASELNFTLQSKLTPGDKKLLIARMIEMSIQDYGTDLKEALHNKGIVTANLEACQNTWLGTIAAGAGAIAGAVGAGGATLDEKASTAEGYEASCWEIGARIAGYDDGKTIVTSGVDAADKGLEKQGYYSSASSPGELLIPYFYLGDLIDIAVEKALGPVNQSTESKCNAYINPSRVKNMRVLLGSISINSVINGSSTSTAKTLINIADIPVAFEYFRDFYARRVTKQKKSTYSLNDFIKDCLKDFALRSLGDECFDGQRIQDLVIKDVTLSLPALQGGKEPIKDRIIEQKKAYDKTSLEACRLNMGKISNTRNPLSTSSLASSKIKDTFHYKMFFLQNKSASNMRGNPSEDLRNGIIHLNMGEDRGLLKNISFKRAQFPGLREQRVVEQDEFNPLSHLADVYNIDVTMIGNTVFWPGQYVYVNPIGFGTKLGKPQVMGSPSRAMGIGGYHLVTQVSSFIENGKFETTVSALWETSGGPGAERNDRGQSTGVKVSDPSDNASSSANLADSSGSTIGDKGQNE